MSGVPDVSFFLKSDVSGDEDISNTILRLKDRTPYIAYKMAGGKLYISAPRTGGRGKRNYVRQTKRTNYRRRRPRYMQNRLTVGSHITGFPNSIKTKLVFDSGGIGAAVTTTPFLYQYRSNSVFKPDQTTVGNKAQPRFFDQLAVIYKSYRVLGVKVEINAHGAGAGSNGFLWLHWNSSGVAAYTDSKGLSENSRYIRKTVHYERGTYVKHYLSIASIEGVSRKEVARENDFSALVGESPHAIPNVNVSFQHVNGSDSFTCALNVRLTYYVTFFGREDVVASTDPA